MGTGLNPAACVKARCCKHHSCLWVHCIVLLGMEIEPCAGRGIHMTACFLQCLCSLAFLSLPGARRKNILEAFLREFQEEASKCSVCWMFRAASSQVKRSSVAQDCPLCCLWDDLEVAQKRNSRWMGLSVCDWHVCLHPSCLALNTSGRYWANTEAKGGCEICPIVEGL